MDHGPFSKFSKAKTPFNIIHIIHNYLQNWAFFKDMEVLIQVSAPLVQSFPGTFLGYTFFFMYGNDF
jgi:hypothetical protein